MKYTPYLIQRARFANNSNKKGIDSILSFDYMGSSEFEWGALPKSLGRVRANPKDYWLSNIKIGDKNIDTLCISDNFDDVVLTLTNLAQNKIYLKESSYFDRYINNTTKYIFDKVDFWWDIENDYFFWKSNYEFCKKFYDLLFNS